MENILKKLVNNSQSAIDDGVYEISAQKEKSRQNLNNIIKTSIHAPLITEIGRAHV